MIDVKELRIGNQLWNGVVVAIESEDVIVWDGFARWRQSKLIDGFEPIPLSEEWLLKMGFESVAFKQTNSVFYTVGDIDIFHYLDTNVFKFDMIILNEGIELKHVHELQNLYFAITNKELQTK